MNEQELASVRMFEEKAFKAAIEASPNYKAETENKKAYARLLLARLSMFESSIAA